LKGGGYGRPCAGSDEYRHIPNYTHTKQGFNNMFDCGRHLTLETGLPCQPCMEPWRPISHTPCKLTLLVVDTSAPAATSFLTTAWCPSYDAQVGGVLPSCSSSSSSLLGRAPPSHNGMITEGAAAPKIWNDACCRSGGRPRQSLGTILCKVGAR
jgi:hypothetical protein